MSRLKIVFMGTPDFAVPSLRKILNSSHQVVAVVTQPDKPRGRGQRLLPTPVKKEALSHQISPVFQPVRLKDPQFIQQLKQLNADLFVVVAFRILPVEVFTIPPLGTINVHPSLLPKYRGAAPINWTIINGEQETGVTIIRITEKVDAGNILLQKKVAVLPDETAGSLHDRLAEIGADLLVQAIDGLAENRLKPQPQSDQLAMPAPKITPEMRHISFRQPAEQVKNWIHGLSPFPAGFVYYQGKLIKLYRAKVVDAAFANAEPGTILTAQGDRLEIACQPGIVRILELQREGKKMLSTGEFLRGQHLKAGEKFE